MRSVLLLKIQVLIGVRGLSGLSCSRRTTMRVVIMVIGIILLGLVMTCEVLVTLILLNRLRIMTLMVFMLNIGRLSRRTLW